MNCHLCHVPLAGHGPFCSHELLGLHNGPSEVRPLGLTHAQTLLRAELQAAATRLDAAFVRPTLDSTTPLRNRRAARVVQPKRTFGSALWGRQTLLTATSLAAFVARP